MKFHETKCAMRTHSWVKKIISQRWIFIFVCRFHIASLKKKERIAFKRRSRNLDDWFNDQSRSSAHFYSPIFWALRSKTKTMQCNVMLFQFLRTYKELKFGERKYRQHPNLQRFTWILKIQCRYTIWSFNDKRLSFFCVSAYMRSGKNALNCKKMLIHHFTSFFVRRMKVERFLWKDLKPRLESH